MSLRSRPYDTFITRPLSDRAINNYIRAGRYGPKLQEKLLAHDAARAQSRLKRKPKPDVLDLDDLCNL